MNEVCHWDTAGELAPLDPEAEADSEASLLPRSQGSGEFSTVKHEPGRPSVAKGAGRGAARPSKSRLGKAQKASVSRTPGVSAGKKAVSPEAESPKGWHSAGGKAVGTPGTGRGGKGDKAAGGARTEAYKGKSGLGRGASLRKPPHGRTSSSAAQLESLSDQGALATAVAIATGGLLCAGSGSRGPCCARGRRAWLLPKLRWLQGRGFWSAPAQQHECCWWMYVLLNCQPCWQCQTCWQHVHSSTGCPWGAVQLTRVAARHRQAAWQVSNMPPAGVQDPGTPEEQWQVFQNNPQLLVAAPDDEVIAEILALQGELLQQVGRPRLQTSLLNCGVPA